MKLDLAAGALAAVILIVLGLALEKMTRRAE